MSDRISPNSVNNEMEEQFSRSRQCTDSEGDIFADQGGVVIETEKKEETPYLVRLTEAVEEAVKSQEHVASSSLEAKTAPEDAMDVDDPPLTSQENSAAKTDGDGQMSDETKKAVLSFAFAQMEGNDTSKQ